MKEKYLKGTFHNNWEVLDVSEKGGRYRLCKCIHCGNVRDVSRSQLSDNSGYGSDTKCRECVKLEVGSKYITVKGYDVTVIKYNSATDVIIQFDPDELCPEGYIKRTTKNYLLGSKTISYPFHRGFSGIGYMGCERGVIQDNHTMDVWAKMIQRCYNPNHKDKSYSNCTVCDEWHSYKNFNMWYEDQKSKGYWQEGWQLDKDVLVPNGKIYCPDQCCLIPEKINSFLNNFEDSRDTGLPSGVNWKEKNKKYQVSMKALDDITNNKYIALVSDPKEGYRLYQVEKESNAKILADRYRDLIRSDVYIALINWKCPDWDWEKKKYIFGGMND